MLISYLVVRGYVYCRPVKNIYIYSGNLFSRGNEFCDNVLVVPVVNRVIYYECRIADWFKPIESAVFQTGALLYN